MNIVADIFRCRKTKDFQPMVLRLHVKRLRGKKACLIEVRTDQSVTDLDLAIRRALGYDGWDHCSAFFDGVPWKSTILVEAYPDNSAPGQLLPLHTSLPLVPGATFSYVYDFGDNLQHSILVEDASPVDDSKQYPCILSVTQSPARRRKKRPRTRYS